VLRPPYEPSAHPGSASRLTQSLAIVHGYLLHMTDLEIELDVFECLKCTYKSDE